MAGIHDGILYIRGTDSGETIKVRQQNNAVQIDGLSGSYNIDSFQSIVVRAFGGLDKVYLNSEATSGQQPINKPSEIMAGAGNDEITGGQDLYLATVELTWNEMVANFQRWGYTT